MIGRYSRLIAADSRINFYLTVWGQIGLNFGKYCIKIKHSIISFQFCFFFLKSNGEKIITQNSRLFAADSWISMNLLFNWWTFGVCLEWLIMHNELGTLFACAESRALGACQCMGVSFSFSHISMCDSYM